jgi:LmbE family N-acetylglucosaminyl deacetylase
VPHENKDAERFLNKHHKTILIVAHQDDDVIGAGCWLQNHASVHVSYCTDGGAPVGVNVWRSLGLFKRSEYVDLRNQEASAALKLSGARAGTVYAGLGQKLTFSMALSQARLTVVQRFASM